MSKVTAIKNWQACDVINGHGRRAIITGANSGLGFHTALELARHGFAIVMAVRDVGKGESAAARIRSEVADAQLRVAMLDLGSLASVREFATRELWAAAPLDLLINNAGIMAVPTRQQTVDGFELQIGTNHFGHFLLTGLLWPLLLQAPAPRVVSLSSHAHWTGRMHFDDVDLRRGYTPWKAYGQSKLANLLFALELHRRSTAAELTLSSIAAHPGAAATNLVKTGALTGGTRMPWTARVSDALSPYVAQSAAQGAIPSLYAAAGSDAQSGAYYGPSGLGEVLGKHPKRALIAPHARNAETAAKLWALSEQRCAVHFV